MTRSAFVDESQRSSRYTMAAAVIRHEAIAGVRRQLRLLAPDGGIARRHFSKESDASRHEMLRVMETLDLQVVVYTTTLPEQVIDQRGRCLAMLVDDLREGGLSRVVLDHVEPVQRDRDRAVLRSSLGRTGITYSHEIAHSTEELLWVPDAVAWCLGRKPWMHEVSRWAAINEV